MEVYLYCSYSGAQQGFTLSRAEAAGAVPVTLLSQEPPESLIRDFFFFDRFRILWLEYPLSVGGILSGPAGGLFGMRSLKGQLEGRSAVANFMIHAGREELPQLESLARSVLSAPADFARQLFSCLHLGGPCGYTADPQAISELLHFSPSPVPRGAPKPEQAPTPDPNAGTGAGAMASAGAMAGAGAEAGPDSAPDADAAAAVAAAVAAAGTQGKDREKSPGSPLDLVSASSGELGRMNPRSRLRFAVYLTSWEDASQALSPSLLWRIKPSQALSEEEYSEKFGSSF